MTYRTHYDANDCCANPALERWREVPELKGRYEISSYGRVRSIPRQNSRGGILRCYITKAGYQGFAYHVLGTRRGTKKNLRVNRVVAKAFIPNPENKPVVNHKDSNRLHNCIFNLEWATDAENVEHSRTYGSANRYQNRGEGSGHHKLSTIQVVNIWHLRGAVKSESLAALYNVAPTTVRGIWSGNAWKHLKLKNISTRRKTCGL